jgi:hypothetical protein
MNQIDWLQLAIALVLVIFAGLTAARTDGVARMGPAGSRRTPYISSARRPDHVMGSMWTFASSLSWAWF